ncbi:MAG: hypothetical protein HUJ94_04500 [Bacteroidales bacterium]|nr:hypothetical protein [Bacteroidales bacterium]
MKVFARAALILSAATAVFSCGTSTSHKMVDDGVKTTFQSSRSWRETIDNRADAVMVYGVGGNPSDRGRGRATLEEKVASWKERGYVIHFMTGIAWGEYKDYFTGEWDGEWHLDEGQKEMDGDTIWHGRMVPYIVPSMNFLEYMKEKHVKRVIDAGVEAIFMEEPEFWARAGYSEAFKREWQDYYGEPWRPQDESPEATYMSSKLKYHLYYRALNEVFTYAKEYGRSKGMDIKCYVPTHSLVNYSQWQIVSPEASLASLDCVDGYIAQVWTGTSREPDFYNGVRRERVFETAYLEYGSMASMTEPTGRKMFFLTDPIEDWPRDWMDYRKNYQATFTAQLLYPQVANYEVMPWPERIYEGLYKIAPDSDIKDHIPADFATMMQIMYNSLNKVPESDNKVSGDKGISVLMGNSLMFQRFPIHKGYNDPQLSNFYGEALPLVKKGVPVGITHLENLGYKPALAPVKILLMSYSNMKPLDPAAHKHLAKWVKKGGVIVYSGRDDDPFQTVAEWWNKDGNSFACPADHLFSLMGIPAGAQEGEYKYGKGLVRIIRQNPKEYILHEGGDTGFVNTISELYASLTGKALEFKNSFRLERGVYDIVACMDESVSAEPLKVEGVLIDLYDPELPVLTEKYIEPNRQGYFVNMARVDKTRPSVIAAASRESDEQWDEGSYSFIAKAPVNTHNVSRIYLPNAPESVKINGEECVDGTSFDTLSSTCLIEFENSPEGVKVEINY